MARHDWHCWADETSPTYGLCLGDHAAIAYRVSRGALLGSGAHRFSETKVQHWRAFQAINALQAWPVLEFDVKALCNLQHVAMLHFRTSSESAIAGKREKIF